MSLPAESRSNPLLSARHRDRKHLVCGRVLRLTVVTSLGLAAMSSLPAVAHAEEANVEEVQELERVHGQSITTRRALADTVLVAGLVSVAVGGVLIIPDAEDQAFRFAGLNTALFGAINTVVALVALRGIAKEEDSWTSSEAAAARRTPDGLRRARAHAASDEQRESASHAINLGLGAAYLAVAGTAILASRLGVDRPNYWLGSGIAIGAQALFLVGVDFIGLRRASHYHRVFVDGLVPGISVGPSEGASGTQSSLTIGGKF